MSPPLFALVLGALAARQEPTSASGPLHRMFIEIVGPLALVQVERSVAIGDRDAKSETVLDLDLPDGARLVDGSAQVAGETLKLATGPAAEGRVAYAASLAAQHLSSASVPAEDVSARVHLAPLAGSITVLLRYRYTAPLACRDGRMVLHLPGSQDADPVPAEVTVRFNLPKRSRLAEASVAGVPVNLRKNDRQPLIKVTSPRRAAWDVSFALRGSNGPFGNVLAVRVPGSDRHFSDLAVVICRPQQPARNDLPGEAILLIDRSRSVGPGGMSIQRALARAVLEALPPAERFNAIMFARSAVQVFPLARTATREAIDALVAAADPHHLENGTDLPASLAQIAALNETAQGPETRLLVIITDGAIPESQSAERLASALGPPERRDRLRLLIFLVRPPADEPVATEVVDRLGRFAGRFGGVLRVLSAENIREVVDSSLVALRQDGDLFNLRLAGKDGLVLSPNVAPGQGVAKMLSGHGSADVGLVGEFQGTTARLRVSAPTLRKEWRQAKRNEHKAPAAWFGRTKAVSLFIEEIGPTLNQDSGGIVRGQMDPMVLRNALALAFLPRARACYLSRRVTNGTDLNLRGRVRLELHLQRGELEDAVVTKESTLNRPEIEHCLREAAFEIEYPRPELRNAPTMAIVNLVFRPSTVLEEPRRDASKWDREIDLILGPVTFDPKKLLEEETNRAARDAGTSQEEY